MKSKAGKNKGQTKPQNHNNQGKPKGKKETQKPDSNRLHKQS